MNVHVGWDDGRVRRALSNVLVFERLHGAATRPRRDVGGLLLARSIGT